MNFYYITVATQSHPILHNIVNRIEQKEENIYILGLHEKRPIGWNAKGNFGVKLKEVRNFIFKEELKEQDIVLFTDAYDVIYTGSLLETANRYLKMNSPIVFGCETTCNPDPEKALEYKKRDVQFPYLNSGMFIGSVKALRECMKEYQYNDNDDDQRFWTTQFFNRPDMIMLDYENTIFLNTYGINIEDICWNRQQCIYNNKNPMFVHVNGPDKSDLQRFL